MVRGFQPAIWVLCAAILVASGFARACERFPQPQLSTAEVTLTTESGSYPLTVELALTPAQRACGLMGRPKLADDQGMLFDMRPVGAAYFWMDNTPEPLDMLFLGEDGAVLHIEHDAVPYSRRYRGTTLAVAAVLELSAGSAERLSIRLGDRLTLPW